MSSVIDNNDQNNRLAGVMVVLYIAKCMLKLMK